MSRTSRLLLAAGLALRLAYAGWVFLSVPAGPERWRALDVDGYAAIARNMSERGEFALYAGRPTAEREPFYPVLLLGVRAVFGDSPAPAVLLNVLIGMLACVLCGRAAAAAFGPRAGLLALGASCLYPEWVYYSAYLYREPLQAALLAGWAALWLERGAAGRPRDYAWMGAAFGALVLTRSPYLPLGAAFLALAAGRSRVPALAAFLLCAAALQAPWVARNWRLLGRPVLGASLGGHFMYLSLLKDYDRPEVPLERPLTDRTDPVIREVAARGLSEGEAEPIYYRASLRVLREEPGRFLYAFVRKVLKLWRPYPSSGHDYGHSYALLRLTGLLFNLPLYLLAALGAATAIRRRLPAGFFVGAPAAMTLVYGLFWAATRYRSPLMACVFPLAALTAARLKERIR